MTPGDLTIACDQDVVPFGRDIAFRAERHTEPVADVWMLCVSTNRPRVKLAGVSPPTLRCWLDEAGVLRLAFPSSVRAVNLAIDSGDMGESEWAFWVDDVAGSALGSGGVNA